MKSAIVIVPLCWAACLWSGSLLHGLDIFDRHRGAHIFVVAGLLGGILTVGVFRLRPSRYYLLVLGTLVLQLVYVGSWTFRWILRDVVFIHALGLAVCLGAGMNGRLSRLAFGKFVLWAPN